MALNEPLLNPNGYRLLYFFHGHDVVVLAPALTREDEVPKAGIERAIK
jgi:hypothetical protein